MPKIGTTVRLQGTFKDLDGKVTDLDAPPTIYIYDGNRKLLDTTTSIRSSTGIYYQDYTIPDGRGNMFLEMSGKMGTLPVTHRRSMRRSW